MIYNLTGKPRAGKSYFALKQIVNELLYGHRTVVTNLAINIPRLQAWIQKRHPNSDVDLNQRLRLINDIEIKQFWLYRRPPQPGDPGTIEPVTKAQHMAGQYPVWPEKYRSVFYVIDEAHIPFDARCWDQAGHTLTYYNSQHGKLDDNAMFITQFLELLDKRVRMFGQLYIYAVNQGLRRVMSLFSPPRFITVKAYSQPYTRNGGDYPEWATRFLLDKELADCYDTSQGVGMPGAGQPEKQPKKGLSLIWVVPAIAAAAIAGIFAVKGMIWGVRKGVGQAISTKAPASVVSTIVHQDNSSGSRTKPPVELVPPSVPVVPKEPVWVRSLAKKGKTAYVVLSDGREYTYSTGLVEIRPDYVVLSTGEKPQRRRTIPKNSKLAQQENFPVNPPVKKPLKTN